MLALFILGFLYFIDITKLVRDEGEKQNVIYIQLAATDISSLQEIQENFTTDDFKKLFESLDINKRILYFSLISRNYEIIYDKNLEKIGRVIEEAGIRERMKGRELSVEQSYDKLFGQNIIDIMTPLYIKGVAYQYLKVGFSTALIEESIRGYNFIFILIGLVFALVIFGLLFYLTTIIQNPLNKLMMGIEELGHESFDYRIDIQTKDEFGKLANSFNQMAENLKKSRDKIANYSKELEQKVEERTHDLKNAKVLLEDKNQELDRINKVLKGLKLKTEFLHVINHQLRTPISAMRGYLEFWKTGKYKKFPLKKQEEIKNNIIIASDQLAGIINNMVDALELEMEEKEIKLDLKKINLKQLVEEIYKVDFKQHFQNKKIGFELNSEKEPIIQTDKNFVSTIIFNLLDNALKYTLSGKIKVRLDSNGNYAIIEVKDMGIGLTESDKTILFQKFARSEEATKISPTGSGLGLFIVKKMIEILHGEITVKSQGRNQGSTFTVKLPNYYSNENN